MTVHFADFPTARGDELFLLLRNRLVDRAGTTVTSDSEDASGNMGANYLLTEVKSDAYRSGSVATRSGAGTPEILITHALSAPRAFNCIGLCWTNLRLPWRADFYIGDPDTTGVLQGTTDWTHPIVRSKTSDFTYDTFPWLLGPTDERLDRLAAEFRLHVFQTLAATLYGIDYIRLRIDCTDGDNGGVDYVQASLPVGGVAFRPRLGMSFGTTIEPVSRTKSQRSASGTKTGIGRRAQRGFSFGLEHLTDDEAAELGEWIEEEGEYARLFVWREPDDRKRRLFHNFAGAFIGTAEQFDGIGIEEPEAGMDGVIVAKSVRALQIEETE